MGRGDIVDTSHTRPTESAPYLHDGSVIAARDTSIPRPGGRCWIDSALVKSIPKDKLGQLLDESFTAFDGAGYDLESMLDSSAKLSDDAHRHGQYEHPMSLFAQFGS